jgi:hypothetical protein
MKLQDFYPWLFCNSNDDLSFAIEPEISSDFQKNLNYDDYKEESENIYELTNLHNQWREERQRVHDEIKDFYKEHFPIGYDRYLSGWVHFVLFWDFSDFKEKNKELKYKILNCPLHLKIYNWQFYWRELLVWCKFTSEKYTSIWGKYSFVSLKDELFSHHEEVEGMPIEFRCNNVFDERILWYYQWILLAVQNDVKFKKTSEELRDYARKWDRGEYCGVSDVHISETIWHIPSDYDMKAIRHNIRIILRLLRDEWLNNSAIKLKEYLNENW